MGQQGLQQGALRDRHEGQSSGRLFHGQGHCAREDVRDLLVRGGAASSLFVCTGS